jgi:hypothetical protein
MPINDFSRRHAHSAVNTIITAAARAFSGSFIVMPSFPPTFAAGYHGKSNLSSTGLSR